MNNRGFGVGLAVLFASALATYAAGCDTTYQDYVAPLLNPNTAIFNDGGADGADGADGSAPDCSGDPSSTNVIDPCGVFAQADAPAGGDGSMAAPFAKLGDAVAAAQTAGKHVYACTSAPFKEAVTISAGIEVYGGFDCTKGWAWSQTARATLDGPADAVALTLTSTASGAKVEGFAITGASPSNMMMGGSSIAVAVADVAATLDHCDVTASDAADGAGGTPSAMAMSGSSASAPTAMTEDACITPAALAGGAPGSTKCGSVDTNGGVGGKGGITGTNSGDGQSGGNGGPLPTPNPTMAGLGGVGQTDPTDPTKLCQRGQDGLPGSTGGAGPGGSPTGDALSLSGVTNSDATDGQPGTPGQGGGGGGGAMSGTFCGSSASPVDGNGASGGGGGAGGCGGGAGGGGKAGGSSIAIVSLGTNLTLTSVTLAVAKAGTGGSGVAGQSGGAFGNGANGGAASGIAPSKAGCAGGNGGAGGDGGPGGGGRGGHAIGIAYAVTPTPMPALQMFTPGTPGGGGTAGSGAPSSSNGASGNQGQCWDFAANAACK